MMKLDTLKARIQRQDYVVDPDAVAEAMLSKCHTDPDPSLEGDDRVSRPDARTHEPRVSYLQPRA